MRNGLTCRVNLTNPGERCIPFPPLNTDTIGGNLPQDFKDYIFRGVEGNTDFDETMVGGVARGRTTAPCRASTLTLGEARC